MMLPLSPEMLAEMISDALTGVRDQQSWQAAQLCSALLGRGQLPGEALLQPACMSVQAPLPVSLLLQLRCPLCSAPGALRALVLHLAHSPEGLQQLSLAAPHTGCHCQLHSLCCRGPLCLLPVSCLLLL